MKISDLRARINSYIVLVFLVLMTAFGYALVAHQNMLYRGSTEKVKKSIIIFHWTFITYNLTSIHIYSIICFI